MKGHLFSVFLIFSLFLTPLQCWNGEQYDRASDAQFAAGLQLIQQAHLKGDERVLDLGCGTCRLAAHIAQNCLPNGSVVAIDNSESMIQKSLEKQANSPIDNLTIELRDACKLNYHQEFDVVVSVFCLHWIQEIESMQRAIQGIAQSLKPGGKFFAVFNLQSTDDGLIPLIGEMKKIIQSDAWSNCYEGKVVLGNDIPPYTYQQMLERSGFEATVTTFIPAVPNRTEQQQKASLLAIPLGQAIPLNRQEDFLNEALAMFEKAGAKNEDGTYRFILPCGMITALKK